MFIVNIAGHIGKDPETRFTPSGQKVTTFTLAVNQRKGKEEVTTWVRITVWGDRFDKILSYLKKGSGVIIMGRMNPPSSYTDKEGRTQFTLEVTAEMIEFSPFGRSDRSMDGQSTSSQTSSSGSSTPQYHEEGVQNDYSRQAKPQLARSPQYGQANAYSTPQDEDDLPF